MLRRTGAPHPAPADGTTAGQGVGMVCTYILYAHARACPGLHTDGVCMGPHVHCARCTMHKHAIINVYRNMYYTYVHCRTGCIVP